MKKLLMVLGVCLVCTRAVTADEMQCLAQHKSEVSDGCKQAIAKARQNKT